MHNLNLPQRNTLAVKVSFIQYSLSSVTVSGLFSNYSDVKLFTWRDVGWGIMEGERYIPPSRSQMLSFSWLSKGTFCIGFSKYFTFIEWIDLNHNLLDLIQNYLGNKWVWRPQYIQVANDMLVQLTLE